MKKIIGLIAFVSLGACASKSASRLNCEKLHNDSEAKLIELQQIFSAYQTVNYDLAMQLAPPLKEQVDQLDSRVKSQKQKCWAKEKRAIDNDMALLKDELFKVYGGIVMKKVRAPASVRTQPAPLLDSDTPRPSRNSEELKATLSSEELPEDFE